MRADRFPAHTDKDGAVQAGDTKDRSDAAATGTFTVDDNALGPPRGRAGRLVLLFGALVVLLVVACITALAFGPVPIGLKQVFSVLVGLPVQERAWRIIVFEVRLPAVVTAATAGAALGVAGLQMQTLFRNPLADPFILGVSAGAGLGVAAVLLPIGATGVTLLGGLGIIGSLGIALAAGLGAAAVLIVILVISRRVSNMATVLIIGLMIGYVASAVVSVLVFAAREGAVRNFLTWSMGSFSGVVWTQLWVFVPLVACGVILVVLTTKSLDALLLGEKYAQSMGLATGRARIFTIATAAILAGAVTAFCGPIGFLGIAVAHLARGIFQTATHRVLVPAVILLGAAVAVFAQALAQVPGTTLPINAIMALLGAPIVVVILLRHRQRET